MNRPSESSKKRIKGELSSSQYCDIIEMLESDLEDYEIASELGITENRLKIARQEIEKDEFE